MPATAPVIFIVGPTASGKTLVSYELAKLLGGQVINADVGQFYAPLVVGTAKPDWQNHVIKGHLFDICQEPVDFTVVQYRQMVLEKINELQAQGIIPIVVGGSLFYVQSLFFPPVSLDGDSTSSLSESRNYAGGWEQLAAIDPARAEQLHPHDTYRINRALDIWATTGILPSQLQPTFQFNDSAVIISLQPSRDVLEQRIITRTRIMLDCDGWVAEAEKFLDTPWESFICSKGLLGYDFIFNHLRATKKDFALLTEQIIIETRQYAKRQMTFLQGFFKKVLALKQQKKPLLLQQCEDYALVPYAQIARLVAYLQK